MAGPTRAAEGTADERVRDLPFDECPGRRPRWTGCPNIRRSEKRQTIEQVSKLDGRDNHAALLSLGRPGDDGHGNFPGASAIGSAPDERPSWPVRNHRRRGPRLLRCRL